MARPRTLLQLTGSAIVRVIPTSIELSSVARQWQVEGNSIGLVPTMGALHDGHASLIDACRTSCDRVIVSIFVNPIQFDDRRDFQAYPDTFADDLEVCRRHGADVVYRPSVSDMYPSGFATTVNVRELTDRWEGADRPGHFDGVTTVVTKLFAASRADRAFFGRKDFQQAVVVRHMTRDLDLPTEVVVCPTVRDDDGLAESSRNHRLDGTARHRALAIPTALAGIQTAFDGGERDSTRLIEQGRRDLIQADLQVHYVALVDPDRLEPVDTVVPGVVVLVAATCDGVRLIDNHSIH